MSRSTSSLTANAPRASPSTFTWPLRPTSFCGVITQRWETISLHWKICRRWIWILPACKHSTDDIFAIHFPRQRSAVAFLCCTFILLLPANFSSLKSQTGLERRKICRLSTIVLLSHIVVSPFQITAGKRTSPQSDARQMRKYDIKKRIISNHDFITVTLIRKEINNIIRNLFQVYKYVHNKSMCNKIVGKGGWQSNQTEKRVCSKRKIERISTSAHTAGRCQS